MRRSRRTSTAHTPRAVAVARRRLLTCSVPTSPRRGRPGRPQPLARRWAGPRRSGGAARHASLSIWRVHEHAPASSQMMGTHGRHSIADHRDCQTTERVQQPASRSGVSTATSTRHTPPTAGCESACHFYQYRFQHADDSRVITPTPTRTGPERALRLCLCACKKY